MNIVPQLVGWAMRKKRVYDAKRCPVCRLPAFKLEDGRYTCCRFVWRVTPEGEVTDFEKVYTGW